MPSPDASERLGALLADYTMLRDDERQHPLAIAALFTILVAVVFAEATQFAGDCASSARTCADISPVVFALAPSPAFAVLAMTVLIGAEATMRYAYMDALEREIDACGLDIRLRALDRPLFSWQRARRPLVIFRSAPMRRFPFPYLFVVMVTPLVAIVLALTIFCVAHIAPAPLAVAVSCAYALATVLLIYGTVLGWRGNLWQPWPWGEAPSLGAPPPDEAP